MERADPATNGTAGNGGATPRPGGSDAAPRRLVVCCDGTGNEIGDRQSNVLRLYRAIAQTQEQVVFYDPGVGTILDSNAWSAWKARAKGVFGLLTGAGLDENVMDAYRFLVRNWRHGDEIWLFGFSRGAHTARILASLIRLVGILRPHQEHLISYALTTYKRADTGELPELAERLGEVLRTWRPPIQFLGCFDTVGSVIVPRPDRLWLPSLEELPGVRRNAAVRVFRHALAIDERRRMFRPTPWEPGQEIDARYRDPPGRGAALQDARSVWFAGVHGDVGGGYDDADDAASRRPLAWMIEEAASHGLAFRTGAVRRMTAAAERPQPQGRLHESLRGAWWLLELLPRWSTLRRAWREARGIRRIVPLGDRREIPAGAEIDPSVRARIAATAGTADPYDPPNLPDPAGPPARAGR